MSGLAGSSAGGGYQGFSGVGMATPRQGMTGECESHDFVSRSVCSLFIWCCDMGFVLSFLALLSFMIKR